MINKILKSLIGLYVSSVRKGHGSFIFIDFEDQLKNDNEQLCELRVTQVWLYCCKWEFKNTENMLLSDESDDESIINNISKVIGEQCVNITVGMHSTLTLHFSGNYMLKTSIGVEDADQWYLFTNCASTVTAKYSGEIIIE